MFLQFKQSFPGSHETWKTAINISHIVSIHPVGANKTMFCGWGENCYTTVDIPFERVMDELQVNEVD